MRGAASIGRLRHRVGEAIAAHRLWAPGDSVAVAVSGGLDSTCLLDLLLATERWHGAKLRVVTIDHGLHPESSDHAAFVEDLAAARGLPCDTVRLDLPDRSEATARGARYAAFEALPVDRVALAHHRDDQAETILLHLLRGAGLRGLSGMARARDRYVRPLLDVSRAELEAWARWRALRWVEDPTNTDPAYLRNRVRRELVPLLDELRPGAAAALARSAILCAEDDAHLDALTPTGELCRSWVAEGPAPLVARALRRAYPSASSGHIEALIRAARRGRGAVELPGGVVVEVHREHLLTRRCVEEEDIRWG